MKKRIIAALFSLALALGMVSAVPAPASAASGTSCLNYAYQLGSDIQTCVHLTWIKQGDGSGVIVTSVGHSTPQNCGRLESGTGGRYAWRQAQVHRDLYWGPQGCSGTAGVYETGDDYGSQDVDVWLHARVNNGTDYVLGWLLRIYPDGRMVVVDKFPSPRGDCC